MDQLCRFLGSPSSKAVLLLLATAVVVGRFFLAKHTSKRWIATLALAVLALATYLGTMHIPLSRFLAQGPWATFHYFMGAKYFPEVGYYGLYRFVALADQESGINVLEKIPHVRHMETYETMPKAQAIAIAQNERKQRFTDARWEEFKKDWIAMSKRATEERWFRYLNDRGFNPPPFWCTIPTWLAKFVQVQDNRTYMLVRNFDLGILIASIILLAFLAGVDSALIVFLFIELCEYNGTHQVGTYFQFMFLSMLIAGMAFYRSGRWKTAGGFFAASSMLRIFPTILMTGPGIAWIRDLVKNKKLPKKLTALLVSFAIFCALFVGIGLTQGKGPSSTTEFLDNIFRHSGHQAFDFNKFGLKRTMGEKLTRPWKTPFNLEKRKSLYKKHIILYGILLLALVALPIAVIWRKIDDDAWTIPMGMIFIFAGLTLSRYYYLALVVFLIPGKDRETSPLATICAAYILALHSLFYLLPSKTSTIFGTPVAFAFVNYGYILGFIALPLYLLIDDVLKKRALKGDSSAIASK